MTTRSNSTLREVSPSRALCLLAVLLLATQGFAVNQFLTPTNYPTGLQKNAYPVHTLGDFNGDGKLDILLLDADSTSNQVQISVLPGKANGVFGAPILTTIAARVSTAPFAIGDFNGDGKLDIVVADWLTQNLALLLGNGDGTFTYQVTSLAVPFGFPAVADLNGDGKPDLIFLWAAGSPPFARIQGLLSNGDGTFTAHPPLSFPLPADTQGSLTKPILADFNGDGKVDLAFGDYSGHYAFMVLGNGDGTFQLKGTTPIDSNFSVGLAAGDFNRDGKLDLAGNGKILLGNGDGTFQPAKSTAATFAPDVAGDFNGDGKLDLYGFGCTSLGNGNGTFQPPVCFPQGYNANAVADVNGDGKLDLVSWNPTLQVENVALGFGDGTFPAPRLLPDLLQPTTGVATGDFNNDGNPDLAVTTCLAHCSNPALNILPGKPDGTFQPPLPPVSGYHGGAIQTGDFNGDGKIDLLEVDSATMQVFLGNNDGTFLPPISTGFAPSIGCRPLIADINHDGRLDLVAGVGPRLYALLGNGDGTFGAPSLIFQGRSDLNFCSVAGGDFNGDGKIDLAAFDGVSHIHVFTGNGDGTFNSLLNFKSDPSLSSMVVADFNRDGKLDIATAATGVVAVYNGKGDGSFVRASAISPGSGATSPQILTADFNGDGRPDIIGDGTTSELFLALNPATGSFKRELFASEGNTSSLVVADFNHDGAPDVASTDAGRITIYLNTGAVAVKLTSAANPSTVGQAVTFQTSVSPTLRGVIGTPTGTVTFKDGNTILGTGRIKVGGVASFSTSTLTKGQHSITATYSGDGNFIPKTSLALVQVVQ